MVRPLTRMGAHPPTVAGSAAVPCPSSSLTSAPPSVLCARGIRLKAEYSDFMNVSHTLSTTAPDAQRLQLLQPPTTPLTASSPMLSVAGYRQEPDPRIHRWHHRSLLLPSLSAPLMFCALPVVASALLLCRCRRATFSLTVSCTADRPLRLSAPPLLHLTPSSLLLCGVQVVYEMVAIINERAGQSREPVTGPSAAPPTAAQPQQPLG